MYRDKKQLELVFRIFDDIGWVVMEDALTEHVSFDEKGMVIGLDFCSLDLNEIPSGLHGFPKLEILDLSTNKIKRINCLENLHSLNLLDLSNNQITKIEGLDSLNSLKTLELSNNPITIIQGLTLHKNLEVLALENCEISKIQGLDYVRSLKVLNISNNYIDEIEGLENLERLERLYLMSNRIKEVKNLFQPLKTLDLSGNLLNITAFEQMTSLSEENFINWVVKESRRKYKLELFSRETELLKEEEK
ncbi:MAG: leucine-rich repeat domain-containing protein [Candidatus Hodarchaeales archaeon]|jgi:internalin A